MAGRIYYWVRFALVAVVAVQALLLALRRSRAKAARRDLFFGIAGIVALAASVILGGIPLNYLLTAVMLIAGAALGFLAGAIRPLAGVLLAVTFVFATIMLLFGAGGAVAFGASVLAFGVGLPLGQGLRRFGKLDTAEPETEAETEAVSAG